MQLCRLFFILESASPRQAGETKDALNSSATEMASFLQRFEALRQRVSGYAAPTSTHVLHRVPGEREMTRLATPSAQQAPHQLQSDLHKSSVAASVPTQQPSRATPTKLQPSHVGQIQKLSLDFDFDLTSPPQAANSITRDAGLGSPPGAICRTHQSE